MKQYSEKILVAWGEAISGNTEIRDWLMKNGYPELGLFCFALFFDKGASSWLMKNAPHLLALIKGVEGKAEALSWLQKGYPLLHKIAKAADADEESMRWLVLNDRVMAVIAQKIKFVKDEIEEANNDVHRWGFE
ncbi:MAG: hypothetical protein H8D62_00320 [Bacteroidetes bacterium]|nr:hypothetical protein [Bacteroidota bacterium]